jgi:hypothetical protein
VASSRPPPAGPPSAGPKRGDGGEEGDAPHLEGILRQFDTDGSIRRLLQLEATSPELMLSDSHAASLERALADSEFQCAICKVLVEQAHARASKLPGGLARAPEDALLAIADGLCEGPRETLTLERPSNPPDWAWRDHEALAEADGRVRARRLGPSERRQREREPLEYEEAILSTAVLVRSCRRQVHDLADDDARPSLSSALFRHRALGADAPAAVRADFCTRACAGAGADGAARKDEV